MINVKIDSGICGFTTLIHAENKAGYKASFRLETECLSHFDLLPVRAKSNRFYQLLRPD
jgi:hypothetical protein